MLFSKSRENQSAVPSLKYQAVLAGYYSSLVVIPFVVNNNGIVYQIVQIGTITFHIGVLNGIRTNDKSGVGTRSIRPDA
jgi:hypothetical protein